MVTVQQMVSSYTSAKVQWITFRHDWFVRSWDVAECQPTSIVDYGNGYCYVSSNLDNVNLPPRLPRWIHVVRSD